MPYYVQVMQIVLWVQHVLLATIVLHPELLLLFVALDTIAQREVPLKQYVQLAIIVLIMEHMITLPLFVLEDIIVLLLAHQFQLFVLPIIIVHKEAQVHIQ